MEKQQNPKETEKAPYGTPQKIYIYIYELCKPPAPRNPILFQIAVPQKKRLNDCMLTYNGTYYLFIV